MSNLNNKKLNDLIIYCIKNQIKFSEMDGETRDKFISDICLKILKLETEIRNISRLSDRSILNKQFENAETFGNHFEDKFREYFDSFNLRK